MSCQHHVPAALPPGRRPNTHFTGGWVVLGVRYVCVRNISPPPGFEPRTVQLDFVFPSAVLDLW